MQSAAANRFSTKGYSARKIVIALFVLLYAVIADWGGRASSRGEFFPVFNWSLFTYVNPHPLLAELHVVRIGDKKFATPVNYFDLDSYFEDARERTSTVSKAIVRLHRALRQGNASEVATLRRVIESQFLSGYGPVEYEIRSINFSALERWKNKDYVPESTVLARFSMEDVR